jgi:CHAD domain-containing protein
MVPSGKWIDGICAECAVADAASRSLDARLRTVIHWLPLAAYLHDQDVEHVHRLRVSTRRAIAALKLFGDSLPRGAARWMKKRLKKIRRAAGDARDLDVLAMRLSHDYGQRADAIITLIAERRAAAQPAIVAVAQRCSRHDQFVRKTGKLLSAIRPTTQASGQPARFADWAGEQLAQAARRFFAASPGHTSDTTLLHQFRIRAKALRYTIELVAPAFGAELRDVHYLVVEELQERLGRIQDHVTASARLSEWAEAACHSAHAPMHDIAQEELNRMHEAVSEFHEWWNPQRADELRLGISCSHAVTGT